MDALCIRPEREEDWHQAEWITKKAFWNLHVPGCDEHYLVYRLRSDPAFIPALSRVAEVGGGSWAQFIMQRPLSRMAHAGQTF